MWKKWLISAFIVLSLGVVLLANLPAGPAGSGQSLLRLVPPLAIYGNALGLDTRWSLFSNPVRVESWQVIQAEYAGGAKVVLPLAGQSERTFWQRNLFDFKEEMLRFGLAGRRDRREGYAAYLCRRYPSHEGAPVKEIVWDTFQRSVVGIDPATRTGSHVDPQSKKQWREVFPCR
jgi:hypothetical protein